MLIDCKVKYVILGHSERRTIFGEDDELIRDKVSSVINADMIPVLCIGETIDELNEGVIAQADGSEIVELDITVAELSSKNIEDLALTNIKNGIIVKSVGSKNSNLLVDDVIIQVSSEKVSTIKDFKNIIKENKRLKRDKILLRVVRSGNEFWLINPFVVE